MINQVNYTGVHTSRAARIEPITPPGSVYCSQAFAAIVETLRGKPRTFDCQYVGNVPLPKGYGMAPVFVVQWTEDSFFEGSPRGGDGLQDVPEQSVASMDPPPSVDVGARATSRTTTTSATGAAM